MNTQWIDFKNLRARLEFERILKWYKVEVKRKGNQHHGFCPLPNHSGKRNSPSFSANLEKGIFQCFGCGAKGNVLDFAALMDKVDPKDGSALREVAMKLQQEFCPELADGSKAELKRVEARSEKPKGEPIMEPPMVVNEPLDFELKELDAKHPYLLGRGFTQETIDRFGLGYCSRGMLKSRVAIPLHDQAGALIGYAGRVVDDSLISEENPRYRFPGERKRNGRIFEFRKTMFVYNGFNIKPSVDDLIVVEGFSGIWWLTQNGFPNSVAIMGADCSEKQAEIIVFLVKPGGIVWIMPDGNAAGERCALGLLRQISPHRLVRWGKMAEGRQPTDLSREQLKKSFIA